MKRRPRHSPGISVPCVPPLCARIRPLLLAYMSRELEDAPSALVREHLRNCRDCAAEAAEIMSTLDALRVSDSAPGTDALTPRRRVRTLWLMERPLVAWFFLHRHVTGVICAVLVVSAVIIALFLIKHWDFTDKDPPRIEVNIISAPAPARHDTAAPVLSGENPAE